MIKNKKYIALLYSLICLLLFNKAQTPFYTFLNGWRGAGVAEVNNKIIAVSNFQTPTSIGAVGGLKVDYLDLNGSILNTWELKNDSARLEDANPLGYGIVSFNETNYWIGSNYFINATGNTYSNIYRFTTNLDTVNKSILIPNNNNVIPDGGLKNIKFINDSTIILVKRDYNNSIGDYLKIKSIDSSGYLNWQTDIISFQPSNSTLMNSAQIATAADGGYFVTCVDRPDIPNVGDNNIYFLLVKLDANGNLQWKKRITDGIRTTNPGSIIQKDSNSYLVTWADSWLIEYSNTVIGTRKGLDSSSVWMGEIDLQGNFKWKKSLYKTAINCDTLKNSALFFPYNTIKLNDGNYLICVDYWINDATYIKVTPEGDVIWNRKIHLFEDINTDASHSYTNIKYTKEASDGGILGVGEYVSDPSQLFPNGIRKSLLIKLDQYGCMEPGCHLEGCTDTEALNYNPEAVYNCGCIYDPCPEGFKVTIAARHFRDLPLIDFELYKASDPNTNLLELDGSTIVNEEHYNQSICIDDNCDEEYLLHVNYHRTIPPNSELPFASPERNKLGYYAYFNVNINDSTILDIGNQIFSKRDTTFRFKFCTPEPTVAPNINFNLYPNPTTNNITLQLPDEIDLDNSVSLKLFDLSGRIVLNKIVNSSVSIHSVQQLANSIYTAGLYQGEKILFTQKMVKL